MSFISRARRSPASGGATQRAMTLVEMLIAMALTLILVSAIAQFYAYIGPTVKDGRAMIDMVAQLRTATARMRADLERLTLIPRPPAEDGKSPGYFEYFEGNGNDYDSNANGFFDTRIPPLPFAEDTDADGTNDFAQNNYTTMLGDVDDVLAFTIRTDGDPLVGHGFAVNFGSGLPDTNTPSTYTAPRAEVVWFSSFIDQDGDNLWDPNEKRLLHRRQLIVNESLNVMHPGDNNPPAPFPYFFRIPIGNPNTAVLDGMQMYDVALQPAGVFAGHQYFVAKQFFDLTRRENRFAHLSGAVNFSNRIDIDAHVNLRDNTALLTDTPNYGSLSRWVQLGLSGLRKGDDVILANVLAFDVRAFDPLAQIRADNADVTGQGTPGDPTDDAQGVVQPGDAGWDFAFSNNYPVVGAGAYVDLFYSRYAAGPVGASNFSAAPFYPGLPAGQSFYVHGNVPPGAPPPAPPPYIAGLGATYDSWATSYDHDGVTQLAGRTDLGTNGFDDPDINGNTVNGVDDPGERETMPPYPVPLRGIQIKFRMYEPTTRQVRQATIGWDFITE